MTRCVPVGSALPPRRDQLIQATAAPEIRVREDDSIIIPAARDRMLELFEREQLPNDARHSLTSGMSGNLQRQLLLFQAMVDTWPRLQKALAEVKRAVRKAPWKAVPWSLRHEKASSSSEKLAREVENAMWGMKPEMESGKMGFEKTVEELAVAYFFGHQVLEVEWMLDTEYRPSSTKIIPPRFYGYPFDVDGHDRLMLDRTGMGLQNGLEDFPRNKFLVAVNSGHPGHPTVAAPLRALVGYWMAAVYGLKWFMSYAEKFGQPIRWAEYAAGDDKAKQNIMRMMESIGANAWGVFPAGTKLNFVESTKSAGALPSRELLALADEQVAIFVLGQTLTSSAGDKGSQALGTVHQDVRQDVIEGVCDFVGEILTYQLAPAIVELNYGKGRKDIPGIWAVFEKPKNEKEMAERDKSLGITDGSVPVGRAWFYERHNIPVPAEGEDLLVPPQEEQEPTGDPEAEEEKEDEIPAKKKPVKASSSPVTWRRFPANSGSLNIPRAEMPQIASGNRAALVNFLKARGIASSTEEVQADTLKPTQAEYSPEKVAAAKSYNGGNRSILISEDNHVVDGHHQWMAAGSEPIKVIRLNAPITRILMMIHRMPSTTVAASIREDYATPVPPKLTVDALAMSVAEGLSGVSRQWLSPVRPVFERLAALAMSDQVTDEDFVAALEKAQREMPEIFELLNTDALETAFRNAISSAALAGSVSRYEQ